MVINTSLFFSPYLDMIVIGLAELDNSIIVKVKLKIE